MKKNKVMKRFNLIALMMLIGAGSLVAQKTSFTSEDALRMKSFRMSSMTDDGRLLAGTISESRDRLGVDHDRYGDPNYVSPRKSQVAILDVDTKTFIPVTEEKVIHRSMQWSPDGDQLALLIFDGEAYGLQIFSPEKKKMKSLKLNTDLAIASNSRIQWTPDGRHILLSFREKGWAEKADSMFREATVGPVTVYDSKRPFLKWEEIRNFNSLAKLCRVDLSGKVTELLPEGRYGSVRLAKSGTAMSYQQTFPLKTTYNRSEAGSENELMLTDWMDPSQMDTLIAKSKKRIRITWNEQNDVYAYADSGKIYVRSIFDKEPKLISSDTTEIVKKDTSDVKFSVNRWSPTGDHLLVSSKTGYWLLGVNEPGMELVYEFPEDREKAPNLSISLWSPDGRYWYMSYSAKDKWERGVFRYNLETKEMEELVKNPNIYSGLRLSTDGKKVFYNFSDGNSPSELFVTDAGFKFHEQLTDMNPWIDNKKLTKSELVKYRDVDGKELYGVLYYPVDYEPGKKYPLVCEIYEKFFNNGFSTSMNIITNAGYFGFKPSVNLIQGYPGEAWVKGITSGINVLIDRGLVDPDKLGVHGTSYGGYAASLLITQTDRFAAAINISGKVNIISFLGDSPRIGTRNYAAAENGQDRIGETLWEAPMKYFATSAVLFADRVKTPHLLLTGEGDWNVPAGNTREMYYALRRLGKEVVWVNYVNGGHGGGVASDEFGYLDQWKRILEWYEKHFEESGEVEE